MKFSTPFAILCVAVGLVEANSGVHRGGMARRSAHAHHARAQQPEVRADIRSGSIGKRDNTKKCKPRPSSTPTPSSTHPANVDAKKTSATPSSTPKPAAVGSGSGVIQLVDPVCGASGATTAITATDGPNGKLDWLNCGVDGSGWKPPKVTVGNVIAMDLNTALQNPKSPFKACSQFIDLFYKYAGEFNVPPILVASIAMQESTCDPHTVGGGGEQGLMQITKDKCGGAPGGNCQDPDFNVRTGVKYFAGVLEGNNGNLLETVGMYNGWEIGLTIAKATAARHSSCCRCQNNLDYLHQTFNGWMQNVDPYATHMGKYFNLDVCGN